MRRVFAVLWGAALLGALSGCHKGPPTADAGVPDAGPARVSEHEPNDRADQALAITGSTEVSASLADHGGKADEDWYRISSPQPATVSFELSGIPGAKVALELLDESQNVMVRLVSGAEGQGVKLDRVGLRTPLFVRVDSESKGAGGAYELKVTFSPPQEGWEVEPNNRAADATPLSEAQDGWTVKGAIGTAGDEDWYRINLADGGAGDGGVDAGVDGGVDAGTAPGTDAGTDAGSVTGTDAGTGSGSFTGAGSLTDAGVDGGTADGGLGDAGSSTIVLPDGGLLATDGGTAEAIDAGTPVEPKIPLRIELSGVPGVKLEVELLTAAEASLFQTSGEEGQPLSLRNVGVRASDQIVYVVVRSAWVGKGKEARRPFNADVPYTLHVQREEAGANSEIEPNDTIANATPLPLNGYREGFLSPKGDVDLYQLHCASPMVTNLQLSGLERVDLQLSVLEPRADGGTPEEVLRANDGDVKEPEYLNSVACNGDVYVKVESAARKVDGKWVRDFENPDTRYRLTAQSRPDTGAEEREPNNSPEQAMSLSLGQSVRGTIQPRRDVDDYRLDLSNRVVKTAIRATVTPILKVRIGLYLYRLDEGQKPVLVQTADRGKGDKPEVIHYSADPGVYILQVRDVRNRESNFQDAYQLTVEQAE